VQNAQKRIDKLTHEDVFNMLDKLFAMGIMMKVLKEEWHMSEQDIQVQAKLPKLSFIAKAKLLAKIKMMEKERVKS